MGRLERTHRDFSDALRELMRERNYSFPKLAREIGYRLSTTYLHNLASGKSTPTKDNIETIAKGLKVDPTYFKEYRRYQAKEKIDREPEIADLILDERVAEAVSSFKDLTDEQKKEVVSLIKELKSKYQTKGGQ